MIRQAHYPPDIRGRRAGRGDAGPLRLMLLLTGLAVVALIASGCGSAGQVGDAGPVGTLTTIAPDGSQTTTTVPPAAGTLPGGSVTTTPGDTPTTGPSADTMQVKVYFAGGEKLAAVSRTIPRTKEVAAGAVRALLAGPTAEEKAPPAQRGISASTSIPEGTKLLGIAVNEGVARVDLTREYASGGGSLSMAMRLAQVVFTLTQFPTIEKVRFALDGETVDVFSGEGLILDHPVGRADYEELMPAIMVESPTMGESVRSPVRVWGTANVFEASFQIEILDSQRRVLTRQTVQASSGTGQRGTFDVTIPLAGQAPVGQGWVVAFAFSPKDGSRINPWEVPVEIGR